MGSPPIETSSGSAPGLMLHATFSTFSVPSLFVRLSVYHINSCFCNQESSRTLLLGLLVDDGLV